MRQVSHRLKHVFLREPLLLHRRRPELERVVRPGHQKRKENHDDDVAIPRDEGKVRAVKEALHRAHLPRLCPHEAKHVRDALTKRVEANQERGSPAAHPLLSGASKSGCRSFEPDGRAARIWWCLDGGGGGYSALVRLLVTNGIVEVFMPVAATAAHRPVDAFNVLRVERQERRQQEHVQDEENRDAEAGEDAERGDGHNLAHGSGGERASRRKGGDKDGFRREARGVVEARLERARR
mmetsp:Transcript_18793/g.61377  ORF Transcript_18793/g.61377 Transcript_18793/m.61377 type:complete len:238 (+) Transcript_18793:2317-3030(+)